jgi:hypothetical protein
MFATLAGECWHYCHPKNQDLTPALAPSSRARADPIEVTGREPKNETASDGEHPPEAAVLRTYVLRTYVLRTYVLRTYVLRTYVLRTYVL